METLVIADPEFQIIRSGLWQSLAEPRRIVVLAAGGSTTPLTIPYGVVRKDGNVPIVLRVARIAEIIASDEGRHIAPTYTAWTIRSFEQGRRKGPDVLTRAGTTMSEGDTVNITTFYSDV